VIVSLMLGAAFGAGLRLVTQALYPAPPPLAASLDRLSAPAAATPAGTTGSAWPARLAASPVLERLTVGNLRGDLRVTEQTVDEHLLHRLIGAAAGLFTGPAVAGLAFAAGGSLPITFPLWTSLVMSVAGFTIPTAVLRRQAAARRRAFRHAFAAFMDLVALALAGGQGIEGALRMAAQAGDGWAFCELRAALERAGLVGETPWAALDRLGSELDIAELRELAAAVGLAGEQGARVAATVIARAESLRARGMADMERDAQAASERMAVPTVLLLCGFLLFLTYPAVMGVVTRL
jgi:tight adherence protein C